MRWLSKYVLRPDLLQTTQDNSYYKKNMKGNIKNLMQWGCCAIKKTDWLAPLLLRIYLVPVFWVAGLNKWNPIDSESSLAGTAAWFEHTLNMPFPLLMAFLAWASEFIGAILLTLGIGVRAISLSLMVTMFVAATTVHWDNGWQAIHDTKSPYASENIEGAQARLSKAKEILQENGNYEWLTEYGSFVKLNNGFEFAATYFVMLLALFYLGGGRYISLDYWIRRRYMQKQKGPSYI